MPTITAKKLTASAQQRMISVFPSELGWVAIQGHGETLQRLVFGFDSANDALAALSPNRDHDLAIGAWNKPLIARLQAYARGKPDDFRDVKLDLGARTEFQRRVLAACREVKYGEVSSYAQLAIAAGAPRAARAVGTVMSKNCVPLVIPCHRILSASGSIGGYSSPRGLSMKKQLLAIEARAIPKSALKFPSMTLEKTKSKTPGRRTVTR
ncbi:MAG TPA: methylated-DNA--[protein]-cysteine S-methyltransferase [Pirellulales bacterium]|jgi:methylated-DNA-[protein]-cysteine S-methyltransferase